MNKPNKKIDMFLGYVNRSRISPKMDKVLCMDQATTAQLKNNKMLAL